MLFAAETPVLRDMFHAVFWCGVLVPCSDEVFWAHQDKSAPRIA
jgi:hypothetical protein